MKKSPWILACGFIGMVMAVTGAAWACSPAASSPFLAEPSPKEAPAGSQVVVSGGNWAVGTDVEVRWDSETGPVLGTAPVLDDRTFSVPVTIPNADPGVHYLVALNRSAAPVSTTFGVAAPGAVQSSPGDNPRPPDRDDSPSSGGVTSQVVSGGAGTPTSQPTGPPPRQTVPTGPPSSSPAPSSPPPASAPTGSEIVAAPSSPRAPGGPSNPAFADAPVRSAPAPVSNGQEPRNEPSVATSAPTGSAPTASGATAVGAPQPLPSAATPNEDLAPARFSSGDLWSGFPSAEAGEPGSSLLDLPSSKLPAAPTSPVTLAVALLTSSLVALSVGFGLAELFRRKLRVDG